jgi:callose synthase
VAFVAYHSILLLLLFVSPDNIPTNNKKRILDEPLNVRFHYGHPDLFNKTVVMTRGGMAKASKGINLSEDIFSGFNYTLRGKNSTQSDFVQVGKGKDVGFTQISLFNAKISMGNAEQVISRDLNRLAQQFSFLRSFSLYYTCVGSFLGQVLVVISIWCVVYIKTFVAVTGTYTLMYDKSYPVLHTIFTILTDAYVVQVYFLQFITMIMTFMAERGMWRGLTDLLDMVLRGSIIFYAFQVGNKAYYLNTVMMYGGATYKATGRGFVLKHERFKDSFQHYFYSHYLPGLELLLLLIIEGAFFSTKALVIQNVPFGLVAASWLYCPALFNPQGLDYESLKHDMDDWLEWIYSRDTTDQSYSWEKWWQTQVEPMQYASFNTRVLTFIVKCRYAFVAYMFIGAATQDRKETVGLVDTTVGLYVLVGTIVVGGALFAVFSPSDRKRDKFGDLRERRKQRAYIVTAFLICITAVLCVPVLTFTSLFEVAIAAALMVLFLSDGVCLSLTGSRMVKGHDFTLFNAVRRANQAFHLFTGFAILAPLIVISWIPFLSMLQGRVLFNDKFAERLRIALDENKKKLASLHEDTSHQSMHDEEEGSDLSRDVRKNLMTKPTVMHRMRDAQKRTTTFRPRRSEAVSSTRRSLSTAIPTIIAHREEQTRRSSIKASMSASGIPEDPARRSSATAAEISRPRGGDEAGEDSFVSFDDAMRERGVKNPLHPSSRPPAAAGGAGRRASGHHAGHRGPDGTTGGGL